VATHLDPAVTQTVLSWMQLPGSQVPVDPLMELSERERELLPLIADGKTNREIALVLSLSENSVKTYVSNILQKLHLARRAEAAAFKVDNASPVRLKLTCRMGGQDTPIRCYFLSPFGRPKTPDCRCSHPCDPMYSFGHAGLRLPPKQALTGMTSLDRQ
jgi:DNA-binding CsgD family transcriptional regulator